MDNNADEEVLVVEAFLYAGEPVDEVRIMRAVPLTSEDTAAVPVNRALVRLVKKGSLIVCRQWDLRATTPI